MGFAYLCNWKSADFLLIEVIHILSAFLKLYHFGVVCDDYILSLMMVESLSESELSIHCFSMKTTARINMASGYDVTCKFENLHYRAFIDTLSLVFA